MTFRFSCSPWFSMWFSISGAALLALTLLPPTLSVAQDAATIDVDPNARGRMIMHVCHADGRPIRPLVADLELRNKFVILR